MTKIILCDICIHVGHLGHCMVQPWLCPLIRREDAPKRCRLWIGRSADILATLNHRLELIEENEQLRTELARKEASR